MNWLSHALSRAEAAAARVSEFVNAEERDLPQWLKIEEDDTLEVISEDETAAQL